MKLVPERDPLEYIELPPELELRYTELPPELLYGSIGDGLDVDRNNYQPLASVVRRYRCCCCRIRLLLLMTKLSM
jgi:hypothetical protein